MSLADVMKRFLKTSLFLDLTTGLAASFGASLMTISFDSLSERQVSLSEHTKSVFFAVAAYLTVALLLHWIWTGPLKRIPSWIVTAVIGSVLFVCLQLLSAVIQGWNDPYRQEPTLIGYLSTEVDAARSVVLVLSLITLPIAGVAHYIIKKLLARSE